MIFKPYYRFDTGCATYLFGCGGLGKCAVVDPHEHRSGGAKLAKAVGAAEMEQILNANRGGGRTAS